VKARLIAPLLALGLAGALATAAFAMTDGHAIILVAVAFSRVVGTGKA